MSAREQFLEFKKKVMGDIRLVIRDDFQGIFRKIVMDTPVDEGGARANWSFTPDAPGTVDLSNKDISGESAINSSLDSGVSEKGVYFMTNGHIYTIMLEFGVYPKPGGDKTIDGFSTQAPDGMVRINLAQASLR